MSKEMDAMAGWLESISWLDWLHPHVQSLGDFVFFRMILAYLRKEINDFGFELMGRMVSWVGSVALILLTMWILVQGYRIVTGQSRESMMALVTSSLRATLILSTAITMGIFGGDLHDFVANGVKNEIHHVITGSDDSVEKSIDDGLKWMQVGLGSIDVLDVMGDPTLDSAKTRAMWFVGLGTGGPAITGGAMLLLYEVALALFIGLGPLFILCLLFDQTKSLFQRWLLYGIGTMFSMAVLSAMVSIALGMVTKVAIAFWGTAALGSLLGSDFTDGMTSQAMQQGGMGLILTTLIITAPPMAAAFFQGTLGQFMAFSQFQQPTGRTPPGAEGPGSHGRYGGYDSSMQAPANMNTPMQVSTNQVVAPRHVDSGSNVSAGQRGLADPRGI